MKHKMTNLMLLTFFISTLTQTSYGQTKKYETDFKDPKSVVGAIFYAAQSKEYKIMASLPDPLGESDGDVKQLCSIAELAKQLESYGGNENVKKALENFVKTFELGRVTGQVTYEKDGERELAKVPFSFNSPQGQERSKETMKLIKRYGNWYLYSF